MSPAQRAVAALLLLVAVFCAGMKTMAYMHEADHNKQVLDLQRAAAEVKEAWNADTEVRKQEEAHAIDTIRSTLSDELDGVRKRAQRATADARKACEGSSGRELAAGDAEFLGRYAARAAEQQEALKTCYAWIDRLHDKFKVLGCSGGDLLLP